MKTEVDETTHFYKNVYDNLQNHKKPIHKKPSANTISYNCIRRLKRNWCRNFL